EMLSRSRQGGLGTKKMGTHAMWLMTSGRAMQTPDGGDEAQLPHGNGVLESALDCARLGLWLWDPASGRVSWAHGTHHPFGLRQAPPSSARQYLRLIPAGDRPRVLRYFRRILNRSEEHTSELQSRENLVCRLLREKKKR